MHLDQVKKYLIYQFGSESELVKSIEKISYNFTKDREHLKDYVSDEKLVAAYTCFYLATNLPKLKASFEKIDLQLADFADYEFIDIGCGPGTFTLALLEENPKLKIMAVEQSDTMLKQATKLVEGLFPSADVSYYSFANQVPHKEKKRFGIFGHSANEMSVETVLHIIEKLQLDNILFIEPGTKDFFQKARSIRTELLKEYQIKYPCMGQGNCPLPEDDWCHQYFNITHDPQTERLTQLAHRDRRHLPITIHYYTTEQVSEIQQHSRIIRSFAPTKFSLEWQLCQVEEHQNKLVHLQVLTRGHRKSEVKELAKLLAGDKLNYTEEKVFDGKVRGKLDEW